MYRRSFLQSGVAALPVAQLAHAETAPKPKSRIKLGTQNSSTNESLRVFAALGLDSVCSTLPSPKLDQSWSVEGLTKLRERVESFGLALDLVPLPLSSLPVTKAEYPSIMLGRSPERDRAIDDICQMIRNAAHAGIPSLKYNMSVLGVVRTARTPGRGGASLSTFSYAKADQRDPWPLSGPVPADVYWERISYFLDRVIPVANEHKVKMACHPNDPAMPADQGYRGVHPVLGNVAGLKRFLSIQESAYHGLNFCQGTVSESMQNPKVEILEAIRYFGSRKKILNVHFRNIRGGFLNFQETLPDDGDVDMLACLKVYKEVGFDGMLMPDHVPIIEGDEGQRQAFAFCFGYIRALLEAVEA
jgi:mannonate dehydratase